MRIRLTYQHLRSLIDLEGNEACGFLVSDGRSIIDIWPTPSLRPSPSGYSIGRAAWSMARRCARAMGLQIVGSIHTHPDGPSGPSDRDMALARHLRRGALRAVWHPRSGRLTIYDRSGVRATRRIPRPWWFRLIAPLFFR